MKHKGLNMFNIFCNIRNFEKRTRQKQLLIGNVGSSTKHIAIQLKVNTYIIVKPSFHDCE